MLGRFLPLSLAVCTLLVAEADGAASAVKRTGASTPPATTIASAVTSDFRIVLTAERLGRGDAPAATVTLKTYARATGVWKRTGVHDLGSAFFWKTVTGPRALCRLEIRTSGAEERFQPRALVRLLLTPSLGCGRTFEYVLDP